MPLRSPSDAAGVDRHDDPALHVEHAWPGDRAVDHRERCVQRPEREHRVVMPDDERARRPPACQCTCGPAVPVTSSGSIRDAHGSARPASRRCGDGTDVARRRLDAHQPSEVGDHQVGVERGSNHRRNCSDRQPASMALACSMTVVTRGHGRQVRRAGHRRAGGIASISPRIIRCTIGACAGKGDVLGVRDDSDGGELADRGDGDRVALSPAWPRSTSCSRPSVATRGPRR